MEERATGIVLRRHRLTETSLVVHWLTAEQGRVATVAKGALRTQSSFRGKLDLFQSCDISFHRSRRSELHTLREAALLDAHEGLRADLGWVRQASYCSALIEQSTEKETPIPEVHELFTGLLRILPCGPPRSRMVFAFELKLLHLLGLEPKIDDSASRSLVTGLLEGSWAGIAQLKASAAQARDVQRFLHGFLIHHLGRLPKGRTEALRAGN